MFSAEQESSRPAIVKKKVDKVFNAGPSITLAVEQQNIAKDIYGVFYENGKKLNCVATAKHQDQTFLIYSSKEQIPEFVRSAEGIAWNQSEKAKINWGIKQLELTFGGNHSVVKKLNEFVSKGLVKPQKYNAGIAISGVSRDSAIDIIPDAFGSFEYNPARKNEQKILLSRRALEDDIKLLMTLAEEGFHAQDMILLAGPGVLREEVFRSQREKAALDFRREFLTEIRKGKYPKSWDTLLKREENAIDGK
jgi:hypothetical protein